MAEANPSAGFFNQFLVLRGAARELWIALTIKFLNYAAYAVTNLALKRWLSTELGYSDEKALAIVAAWSLLITVATLMVGSLTDAIGLRRTFFLGVWVCIIARAVMVFSESTWMSLTFGLFPLAVGEALGTPVLVAAIRKYSTVSQRSVSFSMSYAMLNVGGFLAGYIFDGVRKALGEQGHFGIPAIDATLSTYRTLFLVSLVIQFLMLPLLWCIRKGAEVTDDGLKFGSESTKWSDALSPARKFMQFFSLQGRMGRGTFWMVLGGLILISCLLPRLGLAWSALGTIGQGGWATGQGMLLCGWIGLCAWVVGILYVKRWHDLGQPGWWAWAAFIPGLNVAVLIYLGLRAGSAEPINQYGEAPRQTGIERLVVFLLLIAFLKLIFMQMYYVFPEFGIRELGEGAPVGALWSINSGLIIFLVPIMGVVTQKYPAYHMVTVGAIISALSVFVMALPVAWFQPMADGWFGSFLAKYLGLKGPVHPYYPMIAIYVVILSIGEAFYSPRVYEYAAAIAPKGQEGAYGALSYVPFLLAKLLIGIFSGALLSEFCPAVGERNSGMMWLAIALFATVAPVGLIALRKLIQVKEVGR